MRQRKPRVKYEVFTARERCKCYSTIFLISDSCFLFVEKKKRKKGESLRDFTTFRNETRISPGRTELQRLKCNFAKSIDSPQSYKLRIYIRNLQSPLFRFFRTSKRESEFLYRLATRITRSKKELISRGYKSSFIGVVDCG